MDAGLNHTRRSAPASSVRLRPILFTRTNGPDVVAMVSPRVVSGRGPDFCVWLRLSKHIVVIRRYFVPRLA
jgi:hypothetical protein